MGNRNNQSGFNTTNGDLHLKNKSLIIRRGLTINSFIQSDLFCEVLKQDDYGYVRYYIKPQIIYEQDFVIVLIFNPDKILYNVNLGLVINGTFPTWSDWSKANQLKNKRQLGKWLKKM